MIYIALAVFVIFKAVIWYHDAWLQHVIWKQIDPIKKEPALFHFIRSIYLLSGEFLWFLAILFITRKWLLSLLFVVSANIVGIVLYEFRFNHLAHGSWKFHKTWGWKVKIGKKVRKISYPKWWLWIIIMLVNIVVIFFTGKEIGEAYSGREKK